MKLGRGPLTETTVITCQDRWTPPAWPGTMRAVAQAPPTGGHRGKDITRCKVPERLLFEHIGSLTRAVARYSIRDLMPPYNQHVLAPAASPRKKRRRAACTAKAAHARGTRTGHLEHRKRHPRSNLPAQYSHAFTNSNHSWLNRNSRQPPKWNIAECIPHKSNELNSCSPIS